jgi:hypothetical protein
LGAAVLLRNTFKMFVQPRNIVSQLSGFNIFKKSSFS